MLEAENLVKQFEKNEKKHKKVLFSAVDHVSLHIKEGEIVGVLGPNGAGKTTLLRMLGCLMQPTEGVVRYTDGDRIITDQTEIKRQIGYLSGNTKLYGRLIETIVNIMSASARCSAASPLNWRRSFD